MQIDTYIFVVWARRSAKSIFGPASNPVMRNGEFLCFKTEEKARAESDRLNAGAASYVRHSVRPIRVQAKLPREFESAESRHPMPLSSATVAAAAPLSRDAWGKMVGGTGIEPVTPTMST